MSNKTTGINVDESELIVADNTTDDVSTSAHGFMPKLPNDAAKFANGVGGFTKPTVTEAELLLADNTTDNVSPTQHGFAPKAPNDATEFLNGAAAYTRPNALAAPNSVQTPPANSTATMSVDESGNKVVLTVKYSNGTVKTFEGDLI